MPTLPIVFTTREDPLFIQELEDRIKATHNSDFLLNYPIVYIHYWVSGTVSYTDKRGNPHSYNKYGVYVGESNDVISRTKQHYDDALDPNQWQNQLYLAQNHPHTIPQFIVIGHEHFNKSLTLDIENRLIEYIMSVKGVSKIHNARGNPQNKYYPQKEFTPIFQQVWSKLHQKQKDLFPPESVIFDSAIFKASPLKKLTDEQREAKELIISKVISSINSHAEGQLIFIQGEAGTGKTVLTTSTFYELIKQSREISSTLQCHLIVNHDQQLTVYQQMAERLDLGDGIVSKPTSFINSHTPSEKVDVCFIDEGHLLLTQGKMSYQGQNQLHDVMDRSRVTVVMFDEYQVLTTEEYWEDSVLQDFKSIASRQNNYITLDHQLRMSCAETTSEWIRRMVFDHEIDEFIPDPKGYEVKSFDSPDELYKAIQKKSKEKDCELSRVVASYDWDYSKTKRPPDGGTWNVCIGNWSKPWNYELSHRMSRREKAQLKNLAWAEQQHTINEIGSTYSIQGFDLSYVGVIIGPSVKYINGKIEFYPSESKNDKATRCRTLKDGSQASFGNIFIRNELKVLLTRGVKGLYIYACDPALRQALKDIAMI